MIMNAFYKNGNFSISKLSEFQDTLSPLPWRLRSRFLRLFLVEASLFEQLSTNFNFGVMVFQIRVHLETKCFAGNVLISRLDFLSDTVNCS